jgi:hypothetical protein
MTDVKTTVVKPSEFKTTTGPSPMFSQVARPEVKTEIRKSDTPKTFTVVNNPGGKSRESLKHDYSMGALTFKEVADPSGELTLEDVLRYKV